MVACDKCDSWYHYSCAAVNASIAGKDFICGNCEKAKSTRAKKSSVKSTSVRSAVSSSRIVLQIQQLDEEKRFHEKIIEEQRILQQKQLDEKMKLEEQYMKRKFELERALLEENGSEKALSGASRTADSISKVNDWLEKQSESRKASFRTSERQTALKFHAEESPSLTNRLLAVEQSTPYVQQEIAKPVEVTEVCCKKIHNSGENLVQQRFHLTSQMSNLSLGKNPIREKEQSDEKFYSAIERTRGNWELPHSSTVYANTRKGENLQDEKISRNEQRGEQTRFRLTEYNVNDNQPREGRSKIHRDQPLEPADELRMCPTTTLKEPSNPMRSLTSDQISARQVMAKELPRFTGDPEEWPLFISCFEMTTECCGYSDVENLMRLQRCLAGGAREAVRCKLMIPSSVPTIIQTLRLLYGRPELIINTLLKKIREVSAPKPDKLETLISFGIAVQNFCGHLQAAGQQQHLSNPVLIQELVDKLPANIKLDWALYKRHIPVITLEHFEQYMSTIISAASSVTVHLVPEVNRTSKSKKENFLNTHVGLTQTPKDQSQSASTDVKNQRVLENETDNQRRLCSMCKQIGHVAASCNDFTSLSVDERWKAIFRENMCRVCLGPHGKWRCRSKQICSVNGCNGRHHSLLHNANISRAVTTSTETRAITSHHRTQRSAIFKILPVILHGKEGTIEAYAFLDDGSSLTLMENELADKLGLIGEPDPLCLVWTSNVTRQEPESKRVALDISSIRNDRRYQIKDVRTVNKLVLPVQTLDVKDLSNQFKHLRDLPIDGYEKAAPKILIGLNNAHLTVTQKRREGKLCEPMAVKTRIGWTIYGGDNCETSKVNQHVMVCDCKTDIELHGIMKRYFEHDNEVTTGVVIESEENKRARHILENTTLQIGNNFQTGLLWKQDLVEFPESFKMAFRRLQCLERRLVKEPSLYDNVRNQLKEYVRKGYAHKLTHEENESVEKTAVWYLPLGIVVSPKKPGKVRLIWDAAAKVNGISLNSMLLKGPDMLTGLPKVLSRFRQRRIAIAGDIQEMYHQIKIRPEDRQAQRFLWRDHPNEELQIYVMDVATFGATCSPCSAQYTKNLNASVYEAEFPRAADAILNSHYVDDFLDSCDTENETLALALDVKMIHAAGGFHIRNWLSNSPNVLEKLGDAAVDKNLVMQTDKSGIERVEKILGMIWRSSEDIFTYSAEVKPELIPVVYGDKIPTKRQVLKCVMSLFDPMGLLAHFTIHGKLIIQDIWRSGVDWDENIKSEIAEEWRMWIKLFPQLVDVSVPRCYFNVAELPSEFELHIFTDASEKAYAAVAYFRIKIQGEVKCALIGGKSKVAPIKPVSIPRLELQAAVLGARIMKSICANHTIKIKKRVFWTDSNTVLCWIRSDHRRYKQFVAFRIGELLSETEIREWRWVPSKLNVADQATKWGKGPQLSSGASWFSGPDFLWEDEQQWPEQTVLTVETQEEMRSCLIHREASLEELLNSDRFSKWERMLRSTAYVFRFLYNCKAKMLGVPREKGYLKQHELKLAEETLCKIAQNAKYGEEMAVLSNRNTTGVDKSSSIYKLTPFMDNHGLLRAEGRIAAALHAENAAKNPIILPKGHRITFLLIDWYHRRYLHANRETIVNEMRQKFYIPHIRVFTENVRKQCQYCRIKNVTPQIPRMGPLPAARLKSYCRPFSYVGIDFFGPLMVKIGRRQEKRWVAVFTCLVIRAVHVEVVHTMSTESCKMAIRRFIAIRGAPLEIYTDNGTNFLGASRELSEEVKSRNNELGETFTNTNTKWMFNPPSAPHMGGVWERMVRSIKTALQSMPQSRTPNDETLVTVLAEAQSIVNSRPLTFVSLDTIDEEALTPNHFLLLSSNGVVQPPKTPTIDRLAAKTEWNLAQNLIDHFWRRWLREYLPVITRRTKWFQEVKPIEVNDMVILTDENIRNSWRKGIVVQLQKGSDNRVRQVIVRTQNGLLRRPVSKLAVLDVSCSKTG